MDCLRVGWGLMHINLKHLNLQIQLSACEDVFLQAHWTTSYWPRLEQAASKLVLHVHIALVLWGHMVKYKVFPHFQDFVVCEMKGGNSYRHDLQHSDKDNELMAINTCSYRTTKETSRNSGLSVGLSIPINFIVDLYAHVHDSIHSSTCIGYVGLLVLKK